MISTRVEAPPRPMLSRGTKTVEPYERSGWIMEPKLDGFRLLLVTDEGGIEGFARSLNPQDMQVRSPWICDEIQAIAPKDYTVIDGELVSEQGTFHGHLSSCMKSLPQNCQFLQITEDSYLRFVAFDLLYFCGSDVRRLPWTTRRRMLEGYLTMGPMEFCRPNDVHLVSAELAGRWIEEGAEGAMIKEMSAPYVAGKGHKHWLKFKVKDDIDVVIMGFTDARYGKGGKFFGKIGAVRFGVYKDGVLTEIGRCSGMDDKVRDMFTAGKDEYVGKVMMVRHGGFQTKRVRFPRFRGFRDDKLPEECTWDQVLTL